MVLDFRLSGLWILLATMIAAVLVFLVFWVLWVDCWLFSWFYRSCVVGMIEFCACGCGGGCDSVTFELGPWRVSVVWVGFWCLWVGLFVVCIGLVGSLLGGLLLLWYTFWVYCVGLVCLVRWVAEVCAVGWWNLCCWFGLRVGVFLCFMVVVWLSCLLFSLFWWVLGFWFVVWGLMGLVYCCCLCCLVDACGCGFCEFGGIRF